MEADEQHNNSRKFSSWEGESGSLQGSSGSVALPRAKLVPARRRAFCREERVARRAVRVAECRSGADAMIGFDRVK